MPVVERSLTPATGLRGGLPGPVCSAPLCPLRAPCPHLSCPVAQRTFPPATECALPVPPAPAEPLLHPSPRKWGASLQIWGALGACAEHSRRGLIRGHLRWRRTPAQGTGHTQRPVGAGGHGGWGPGRGRARTRGEGRQPHSGSRAPAPVAGSAPCCPPPPENCRGH